MELLLAVACDDARVRPDGKVDILGVFNELAAPGFPAVQDRMVVVLIIEWGRDETGVLPLQLDLTDEQGKKVFTIQGHTEVDYRGDDRPPAQTRLIMPIQDVVFPHAGRYHFELLAGDTVQRAFSLFVREWKQEAPQDPASHDRV
jgi:hypothetical protein